VTEAEERIIDLPCREGHEYTDACDLYGFHNVRRAFATQNARKRTADAIQALVRHIGVRMMGLEPMTYGLKVRCSTD
jgi:hypothetical protein